MSACQSEDLADFVPEDYYGVGVSISEAGDAFQAHIHKREDFIEEKEREPDFHYNLSMDRDLYVFDHPFVGKSCGQIYYEILLEGSAYVINEIQDSNCEEEQKYYITTLLQDYSLGVDMVKWNQIINGETVDEREFKIER